MQKTFTKEYMQGNCGCYSLEKLNKCSFMQLEAITLESIVDSEIPLKDKFWFVCKKLKTKEENQQIAIDLAEIVLPIFETGGPDNKAVRECIEAAKLFIKGHISLDELITKRGAAAAYAADNYAAAAAAYAADAADYAAAYCAAAAADCAAAAATAACAAGYKEKILAYLKQITE